jgi:hypothetical protein
MKTRFIYRYIVVLTIALISGYLTVNGQAPNPPGGHGYNGNQGGGGAAPIDGGISILVMAGLGYGANKFIQAKKKKQNVS